MRALVTIAALGVAVSTATAISAPRSAVNLTGTWKYAVVTENGTGTPTVVMKQTGDSLSGTYESGRMGVLPFKGSVKDQTFTFAIATQGGATLTFHGTVVSENVVKGDVDFGGEGGATFSGERQAAKQRVHGDGARPGSAAPSSRHDQGCSSAITLNDCDGPTAVSTSPVSVCSVAL